MGAFPIYPSALQALQEFIVRFIHISRYEVFRVLLWDRDKQIIALGTAREVDGTGGQGEHRKDLFNLLPDIVARDEQMAGRQGPFCEGSVPRQDITVLFEREADDFIVIERSVIEDIEAQQSHPLRESAKHDVGDKFHGNPSCLRGHRDHGEKTSKFFGRRLTQINTDSIDLIFLSDVSAFIYVKFCFIFIHVYPCLSAAKKIFST